MKKLLFVVALLAISFGSVKGQDWTYDCIVNFEDNPCWGSPFYKIDTSVSQSHWHICIPKKQVFDDAFSAPYAILTDSSGFYAVNDTSVFTIQYVYGFYCWCAPYIGGRYKMDSDSLLDYGLIEASLDHGHTWYNLLSDTVIFDGLWMTPKPVFTGTTSEWREFGAFLPFNYQDNDTILYRFTFISDGIQTNRDGWMLDDIKLLIHTEGIGESEDKNEAGIFPNPAENYITISNLNFSNEASSAIYNIKGQLMLQCKLKPGDTAIDISGLEKGIYFVRIQDDSISIVEKLVVE